MKEDSSALEVFRVMDSTNLSGVAVTDALTGKLVGDLCTADLAYFLKLHVSLRLPVLTFRARGVAQQLAATRCVRASCTPLLERDSFELAFRLLGDYRLAAEPIYTAAARRLARAQAKPALLRLLREVGATITDAERDEVVSQALEVWVWATCAPPERSSRSSPRPPPRWRRCCW